MRQKSHKKMIQTEIKRIVEQLVKKYKPEKIILFGSAAQGNFENVNDLDFLVIKEDIPFYGIDRIAELDEIIDRDIAADILVFQPKEVEERLKMGDPFFRAIMREGKILYG